MLLDFQFSIQCFVDPCLSFSPVLSSVLLRFADSDYTFDIFKLFYNNYIINTFDVLQSLCSGRVDM